MIGGSLRGERGAWVLRAVPRLWMLVLVVVLALMAITGWQYLLGQERQRRAEAEHKIGRAHV